MISENMNAILKRFPHSPKTTTLNELRKCVDIDVNEMSSILEDALRREYVAYASPNPYKSVSQSQLRLTEAGQIEIEEYKRTSCSSVKATWAIIISALSLIASVVAIVLSICLV